MDINSISTHLSLAHNINNSFITKCLLGLCSDTDVMSFEQYDDLFRIRHDAVHWLICKERGLEFGEKKIHEIKELECLQGFKYWNEIKEQSPDSITINGRAIKIMELTISNYWMANKEKITKYSLLVSAMQELGFSVQMEVIVISGFSIPFDEEILVNQHKMSRKLIDDIRLVVSNMNNLILSIDSTSQGHEWHLRRLGVELSDTDLGITEGMIVDYYDKSQSKMFGSMDELKLLLNEDEGSKISDDDHDFIDQIVDKAMKMETDLTKHSDCESAILKLVKHHEKESNSETFRSFLPLPNMNMPVTDSSMRSTVTDNDDLCTIRADLRESNDQFLQKVADLSEVKGDIRLTSQEKFSIALQGPGRKKYVMSGVQDHILKQKTMKNFWFNISTPNYVTDIDNLLSHLSIAIGSIENPSGPGLQYVRCCQSIFRELSLNAMRKDRRRDFIFKPTGVKGVFLLLFPGSKLRTGESISQVWFKLITSTSLFKIDAWTHHWAFKKWNQSGPILHSDWLSTDANRLDHYLRCFDRIWMGYLSTLHTKDDHLNESFRMEQSDTLGTILCIYMEDKRSTSKMLQDVRYLIMTSLSIYRYWSSVLEKFVDPLRTPLQALLLTRIIKFARNMNDNAVDYINKVRFGKVTHDAGFDSISDRYSGIDIKLPRSLTRGPDVNFQFLLCEMYFCMLFNKNQDDPTHATFQILSKILDGEESLNVVKKTTGLHIGENGIDDVFLMIDKPHKNQFSKRAIMVGSKLQSLSKYNKSPSGLAHKKAAQDKLLNKPLSDFATYKSSSVLKNTEYNPEVPSGKVTYRARNTDALEPEYRESEEEEPKSKFPRQNPRRRCIEAIIEMIQDGYRSSFDVINKTITDDMYFQIFKKNQIGGTREILILPMDKRITINILESFSRLICREDSREMLTHGSIKNSTLRDMIRDLRRGDSKKLIMNYNLDKTRWGPSFMPIQFLYMFIPFKKSYPSLFRFIMLTLMTHCNKKCLIPEKLLKVWINHPGIKHAETNLQSVKDKFLLDKKLYIENESNMGQGILHYTSSYLHLCALSFRDEVYTRMCKKQNLDPGEWRDIVSSDDSYTSQSLPMDTKIKCRMRIDLFIRAQEVTERLFNIWTSKSKSSISPLIYEFNSMFGSNLTLMPTLFKFSIAAVSPVNTDSFFRMVKESYNTTRQIVENGGSLELYMLAHKMNKVFCESMYHTNPGGANDPIQFGLRRELMPYHVGIYPIGDPGMMILLGPEFHNYGILNNRKHMNDQEINLLKNSHTIIKTSHPEIFADFNELDNIYTGLIRIEAAMGPVKKLMTIKRQIDLSWEYMLSKILSDPLMLFRDPITEDEIKVITYLKLFSFGSAEALRTTAPSIYYARVAATVSAEVFHIPYHESFGARYDRKESKMIGFTYNQCLNYLCTNHSDDIDIEKFYPHMDEYHNLLGMSHQVIEYQPRSTLETRNTRSMQLTEVTMRIKNPIKIILDHYWNSSHKDHPTSITRDWINLRLLVPIIEDSLPATLRHLEGDESTQIRTLILILLRLSGYSSKPMKAVIFGPSSRTYDQSYMILKQYNMYNAYVSNETFVNETVESNPRIYDKLYYTYNYFIMSQWMKTRIDIRHHIDHDILEAYSRDQFISYATKKKIFMMALYSGLIDNISEWTGITQTIMHHWVKRQIRTGTSYTGHFELLLQCGVNKLHLKSYGNRIVAKMTTIENPTVNYELFQEASELLDMTLVNLISYIEQGNYLLVSNKLIISTMIEGFHVLITTFPDINFNPQDITFETRKDLDMICLYDTNQEQIMMTHMGLLATDYIPTNGSYEDFPFNGLMMSVLSDLRVFSNEFSFDYVSREVCLSVLNDLIVIKPRVSRITKERLNELIGDDWPEKTWSDQMVEAEMMVVEESVGSRFDMSQMLNVDVNMDFMDVVTEDIDLFNDYLDPDIDLNLVSALSSSRMKYQPAIIWERLLTLKYNLIARSCVDLHVLSKDTINWVYSMTKNLGIAYSLIYVYDKIYTSQDIRSPPYSNVIVYNDFLNRFGLQLPQQHLF